MAVLTIFQDKKSPCFPRALKKSLQKSRISKKSLRGIFILYSVLPARRVFIALSVRTFTSVTCSVRMQFLELNLQKKL